MGMRSVSTWNTLLGGPNYIINTVTNEEKKIICSADEIKMNSYV
jgi:hypothetical protein